MTAPSALPGGTDGPGTIGTGLIGLKKPGWTTKKRR